MLSRRNLTTLVIETVATATNYPVGDVTVPDPPFGWSETPGVVGTIFTPYSIVVPQTGSYSDGPFSNTQSDWRLPYSISSFGATRNQCEWISDLVRNGLKHLMRTTFDGVEDTYTIQNVKVDAIGGVMKTDTTEPHTFGQTDIYNFWVVKGT